jgi:hypothetical protein
MKKLPGRSVINIQATEKLKNDFFDKVRQSSNGAFQRDMSDTLRGMMLLYVNEAAFRTKVDKFVETTKTL